jgi:hypothetical protein
MQYATVIIPQLGAHHNTQINERWSAWSPITLYMSNAAVHIFDATVNKAEKKKWNTHKQQFTYVCMPYT